MPSIRSRFARRLYENQVGQKIDLLRAETSTAQARQNLVSAQNDYDVAKAAFNDLVGRNLKLPVHLVNVPNVGVKDIPNPDAPVGTTPPNIALPPAGAFTVAQSELTDIDLDKSINEAQVRRPEVIQNSALARAQQVGVRIAREGTEPAFSLSLTGDEYPTPSLGYPRRYVGTLTLNIALPIYDGGKTADLVREAKLRTGPGKYHCRFNEIGYCPSGAPSLSQPSNCRSANRQCQRRVGGSDRSKAACPSAIRRPSGSLLGSHRCSSGFSPAESDQVDAITPISPPRLSSRTCSECRPLIKPTFCPPLLPSNRQ